MKSMTGFAQGKVTLDNFSVNITFKSLNHRFLDIYYKGTGMSNETEKIIKEIVRDKIFRGKVEVLVDFYDYSQNNWDIKFNEDLLTNILDKILYFKERYKNELTLSMDSLLKIPMVFRLDQIIDNITKKDLNTLKSSMKKVFKDFLLSREIEGQATSEALYSSIAVIEKEITSVEKNSKDIELELFKKYKEKIKKYINEMDIDEKRIIQESAILAEKSCITEEINRIKTHCSRLKNIIKDKKNDMKGKECDFMSQELLREISTISAKTNSMEVHKYILLIRREVEKIKQQVQNVE
ncbi:MAG: YicC/YloC family endoribonuclease [Acidobacteriota bacterium]